MYDAAMLALVQVMSGQHLAFLFLGVCVGLVVGILPGLGGIAGMSILLPFLYGMDPTSALGMLIGMVAVIPTGDTFTSVMMGIPGSSASQATVLDGFPMAKKGEAARALSAAFLSSLFGGLIGALILSFAIVAARPLVLSFSSAELFMLTMFGLSMVAVLSGKSLAKGIGAAGLGMIIGAIGTAPATGEDRMTLGVDYLYDGIPLVAVAMGLFAIPEIIDLLKRGTAISNMTPLGGGWFKGIRDVLKHPWLVTRCAGLGCVIGALPGLGGSVVDWIAYSHGAQMAKDKSQFGKGDVRGVIAPESANNACQGGALIPTMLFGVPGSGSMAVFLGGMVLLGIQPGVTMVETRLDLTYAIIWSLAIANVLGAGLCVLLSRPVSRLTQIPFVYLAPFMIMIVMFAAFQATRSIWDLVALVVMGTVGLYMRRFGWPRPALLIGFVLAAGAENYLYQAVQFYDWQWIMRPGVLIIAVITAISVFLGLRYGAEISSEGQSSSDDQKTRTHQMIPVLLLIIAAAFCLMSAFGLTFLGKVFPMSIALLALVAGLVVFWQIRNGHLGAIHDDDASEVLAGQGMLRLKYLGIFYGLVALIWLIGFLPAIAVFLPVFLYKLGKAKVVSIALMTVGAIAFIGGITSAMNLQLPQGVVMDWISVTQLVESPLAVMLSM